MLKHKQRLSSWGVFNLDKISLPFIKILRFIIVFTTARYSTLPWTRRIRFTSVCTIVIPILTLSFRLYVFLPSILLQSGSRHLCHSCCTVNPSHPPWNRHPYNFWRKVRITKFLNTQSPPSSCYDFPLSSKRTCTPCNQTRSVCVLPLHTHRSKPRM
jgi:hypothetical protein